MINGNRRDKGKSLISPSVCTFICIVANFFPPLFQSLRYQDPQARLSLSLLFHSRLSLSCAILTVIRGRDREPLDVILLFSAPLD